jgi:glutathione S-transferase
MSMPEFLIYLIPGSPYGRAVLLALEEKNLPYRIVGVTPRELRTPTHLSRHPFGKVPVLEHDGFRLFETQAILRYIDRVQPQPPLSPAQPQAAARMDQLMNVNDWYLFLGVATVITFQRIVGPRLLGTAPDEAAIAAAMPKAHAVFAELSRQLGDGPYFLGQTLCLADLLLAPQLDFFRLTPEWAPLVAERANLAEWLKRMCARPSMSATTWERVAERAASAS